MIRDTFQLNIYWAGQGAVHSGKTGRGAQWQVPGCDRPILSGTAGQGGAGTESLKIASVQEASLSVATTSAHTPGHPAPGLWSQLKALSQVKITFICGVCAFVCGQTKASPVQRERLAGGGP
jgi:hypothetical protein